MRRVVKKTIGVVLVILGLVALLTPATPGSWLIPIGLELLGVRILLAKKLLVWGRAYPGGIRQKLGHLLLGRKHGAVTSKGPEPSKQNEP